MNLRKANRGHSKIKCALQGPSGSGKTYSALLMARGLCDSWNEVVVIDTENNSADLYSHLGDYNVYDLRPPFTPENYIKAIQDCKNADMKVIVIDSLSHEWEGSGGILTTHSAMAGNSFTNWSKLTPRHNAFVNTILQTDCHIIGTLRTKQDYVLTEKNGKQVPEKVGLKSITRDGMDYEFTVVFDLDIKHQAVSSKDRTGLFAKTPQFEINTNTGEIIRAWCGKALTSEELQLKIDETFDLEELRLLYSQNPQHQNELQNYFSKRRIEIQENGNTIPQN
tara:strand:- start:49006 stop:49845 length:840 start_codon:yes stop_codon:yes gene_type:complete